MKIFQLLFISLIFVTLHANNIEKCLKKCENKAAYHSIKNIDFIYLINLDKRLDRLRATTNMLDKYHIYPYRFSAIDGCSLSLESLLDIGVKFEQGMTPIMATTFEQDCDEYSLIKRIDEITQSGKVYFCHGMERGGVGCSLSHASILQDALECGYNRIWIMEDDIECLQDPNIISKRIKQLDALVGENGWDILYTDKERMEEYDTLSAITCHSYATRFNFIPKDKTMAAYRKNISSEFRQIGARFGTHSIIINKTGIVKILNFLKTYHFYSPIDQEYSLIPDIHLFTVTNDITSTPAFSISDAKSPLKLRKLDVDKNPYEDLIEVLPCKNIDLCNNVSQIKKLFQSKKDIKLVAELGSFYGATTIEIANLLPKDGKIYAIDKWDVFTDIIGHEEWIGDSYQGFLSNIIHKKLTHKVIPVKQRINCAAYILDKKFDLIYVDASQQEEEVYLDIITWHAKLNKNGIMCGNGWNEKGVNKSVNRFANEHNLEIVTNNNFWCYKEV